MAIDVYLQIDGIKGESADSAHQGWIEITSAHLGVTQPRSTTASTAGGHTTGHSEHRTLSLSKLADIASPVLMQHCSMGKTIPKAKLEFMRADGDGKPVKYYQVELENVLLSHMDQVMRDGGLLQDEIGLCFSKVKWTYTQQKVGGGTGGSTAGGWDLAAKKCCA
ncbi:MAG TPA: type VI secretion system tube protein Hcp [Telluria sp.]|nr:type VI secretion system tube protein Hcp [Telluria sp.]